MKKAYLIFHRWKGSWVPWAVQMLKVHPVVDAKNIIPALQITELELTIILQYWRLKTSEIEEVVNIYKNAQRTHWMKSWQWRTWGRDECPWLLSVKIGTDASFSCLERFWKNTHMRLPSISIHQNKPKAVPSAEEEMVSMLYKKLLFDYYSNIFHI